MRLPRIFVNDNITLMSFDISDANTLYALTDRNRTYLRNWLPWLDTYTCIQHCIEFIKKTDKDWKNKQGLVLGIKYDNELVGVISFHKFDWKRFTSGIGYWLSEDKQRQGIMYNALQALIAYGFDDLKLKSVSISIGVENIKSLALPTKLKFRRTQYIKDKEWLYDHFVDHYVYELTREEWKKPN